MSLQVLTQGGGTGGATASIFVTGLSEADTVTATKDGKTVNGKWGGVPNPSLVLPDGYTQLDYISSSGTEYIDTGYTINANTDVELCADVTDAQANGASIFGSRPTYGSNMFTIFLAQTSVGVNYATHDFGAIKTDITGEVVVKKEGLNFYVNGEVCATATATCSNISPTAQIFAMHDRGSQGFYCSGVKLKYLKITESGVLKRDFIPCINPDNEVGVYDLVNGVFYGNSGTGSLIAGTETPTAIGGYIITIKDYGMWTVTATNGEDTTTQDVLVDAAVDYEIEMDYRLWLYREGEEFEDVTGGWVSVRSQSGSSYPMGTATKNGDNLYLSAVRQSAGWTFNNTVDVTEYNTLKAVVTTPSNFCGSMNLYTGTAYPDNSIARIDNFTSLTEGEVQLDISNVTGEYKVHLGTWFTGTSVATTLTIHKVWLE